MTKREGETERYGPRGIERQRQQRERRIERQREAERPRVRNRMSSIFKKKFLVVSRIILIFYTINKVALIFLSAKTIC